VCGYFALVRGGGERTEAAGKPSLELGGLFNLERCSRCQLLGLFELKVSTRTSPRLTLVNLNPHRRSSCVYAHQATHTRIKSTRRTTQLSSEGSDAGNGDQVRIGFPLMKYLPLTPSSSGMRPRRDYQDPVAKTMQKIQQS
jgi:hypothetical protein